MNKEIIYVPAGIRYISDWKDFKLYDFPYILDKKIPGCGFTEWCLSNNEDIILCSPRKILLKNKEDQHKKDVFRVCGFDEDDPAVDKNINNEPRKGGLKIFSNFFQFSANNITEKNKFMSDLYNSIDTYINIRNSDGFKPYKFLVTFDSFRILKDILTKKGIFSKFRVVVDEMQVLFTDSIFKSSAEMDFLNSLSGIQRVCFVSATPMLERYLDRLKEFSSLLYCELDWLTKDPTRISKPAITPRKIRSITATTKRIINSYRCGNFDKAVRVVNGKRVIIESKEAVIFVNSVNTLINIIKSSNLLPSEVNILCANTAENKRRIKNKLGTGYVIGSVPLRDQPRKMFTLCTRTVYLGADFYSDNAKTFVISDSNVNSMMVDISLDLPQILGRQRLDENPWRNCANFYYKTAKFGETPAEIMKTYKELRSKKESTTTKIINACKDVSDPANSNALLEKLETSVKNENYKKDYVAINKVNGSLVAVKNELVSLAEERAFEIYCFDYADRFTVFSSLSSNNSVIDQPSVSDPVADEVACFMNYYDSKAPVVDQLKYVVKSGLSEEAANIVKNLVSEKLRNYLSLGVSKIKAYSSKSSLLDKELELIEKRDIIHDFIINKYPIGSIVTLYNIKQDLSTFYKNNGIKKTAKASDIEEFLDCRLCGKSIKINNVFKTVRCYKILDIKK